MLGTQQHRQIPSRNRGQRRLEYWPQVTNDSATPDPDKASHLAKTTLAGRDRYTPHVEVISPPGARGGPWERRDQSGLPSTIS